MNKRTKSANVKRFCEEDEVDDGICGLVVVLVGFPALGPR